MKKVYFTPATQVVFKHVTAGIHTGYHFLGEDSDKVEKGDFGDYTVYATTIGELTSDELSAVLSDNTFESDQVRMAVNPNLAINFLEEFAQYLSQHPLSHFDDEEIIAFNGWQDLRNDDNDDVCTDGDRKLTFDGEKWLVVSR